MLSVVPIQVKEEYLRNHLFSSDVPYLDTTVTFYRMN